MAQRRVGAQARCACGETRPEMLLAQSRPVVCAACDRVARGKSPYDQHHVAGKANSPVTITVPVNDHRAILSVLQMDWPRLMRENPDGNPLVALAAKLRGFMDTVRYLFEALIEAAIACALALNDWLTAQHGPTWWVGTPIAVFASKGGR